jgi:hypothetical protein
MAWRRHVLQDLVILAASFLFAAYIIQADVVHLLFMQVETSVATASFIAGMFFTSIVTTAPAIAVLSGLSEEGNLLLVAIMGGLGAVVGDYLIFTFVRDRVSADIAHMLSRRTMGRMRTLFRRPTFKWLLPFMGGLILASPLPDELGLALLGAAKLPTRYFVPLSFTFNAAGILLIGVVSRYL